MASGIVFKSLAAAGIGAFAESKFSPMVFAAPKDGSVSPLYFATPTVLLGVGFFALMHGMRVGAARKKYAELAKKDGEKDADERYGLPNLYVDGNSKHARAFNTIQRSHQHIFETFPSVILGGLIGAYQFPITTALSTLLYASGRIALSKAYADSEGDPAKRYDNPLSQYTWYGLLMKFILGFASAFMTMSTIQFA